MKKETTTMNVIVHKANVPLARGETLGQFTREVGKAGKTFMVSKFKLPPEDSHVWAVEVFANKAVFDVMNFKGRGDDRQRYVGVSYTRKQDGSFAFADAIELTRATSFKPKTPPTGIPLTKSFAGDWQEVNKDLWGDVL